MTIFHISNFSKFRKITALFLAVLTAVAALAACAGGKTADSDSSVATSLSAESATATETPTPVKGGKVIVASSQEPDSLDPLLAVAAGTKEILASIYEGLTEVSVDADYRLCLAESYELADDGLTYTFKLKPDVKFHDGSTLNAKDVVWTYDEVKKSNGNAFKNIKEVIAKDDLTVEFKLGEPDADFFILANLPIVKADSQDLAHKPNGTGPFKFVSYKPQESVNLEAFSDYWRGAPHLDAVTFRIIANSDAQWLEFKSGNIDIFPYLTINKTRDLGDSAYVVSGLQNMLQVFVLNNEDPVLKDVKVRAAIDYALDRDALALLLSGEYGNPSAQSISQTLSQYKIPDFPIHKDLEKAKALLKEAGYDNNLTIKMTVPSNYSFHVDTAQVIAAQLQEVGIKVELEPIEWTTWLSNVYKKREYQSTIIALPEALSPAKAVARLRSDASGNFFNYKNPQFDVLLEKLEKEIDESKRVALAKDIQLLLAEDHASSYLQDIINIVAVSNNLSGYQVYPAYIQNLYTVYYNDAEQAAASLKR